MLSAQARSCLVQSSPARSCSPGMEALGLFPGLLPWKKLLFPFSWLYLTSISVTPHKALGHLSPLHHGRGSRGSNSHLRPSWEEFGRIPGAPPSPKVRPGRCESRFVIHPPTGLAAPSLNISSQIPHCFPAINHKLVPAPLS